MTTPFDLAGKRAVVTGSTRGIGRAIAEAFVAAGARVMISSESAEDTDEVARALGQPGIAADVTSEGDLETLVDGALAEFDGLDILVCNAGVNVRKKAIDFSAAEFDTVIGGNLRAYFLCAQAAARRMRASRSSALPTGWRRRWPRP